MRLKLHPSQRRSRLASATYASAVGLIAAAAATLARAGLGLVAPDIVPFALIFPAILVATLAVGPGAGFVAAATGLAAAEYLFVGKRGFEIESLTHFVSLGTAVASSLLQLWLAAQYRHLILARGREREEMIEQQFQLLKRSHGFMFVLAGPELRFAFTNLAYLRAIGQDDVIGKRLEEIAPEIEPEHLDMFHSVRRTGRPFVGRVASRVRAGSSGKPISYVDIVVEPMFAKDGSVEALFIEGYDVTDQVEAEAGLKLLAEEVDHRANNLLAVVQSIVRLSKGRSPEDLQRNVVGRIDALARAHQLLSDSRWRGANLQRLVEEELLPFTLGETGRSRLQGPPMDLNPGEAQALAMGLHELATNAATYGALSTPAGRIEVTWDCDSNGRHICWREAGGPPVTLPTRRGLGANVLERTLRGVGGHTQLLWRSDGLVCQFDLPPQQSAGELG